jgi:hypothetical protein
MKNVAVAVIHGMGSQDVGYADPLGRRLASRLRDAGKDPQTVAWKEIYWRDLTEPRQTEFLDDAGRAHRLDFGGLRGFVLRALADAVAYTREGDGGVYGQIHARIAEALGELEAEDELEHPTPLVVLAHSLGAHVMSNYIWDMQKLTRTGADTSLSAFQRMETLASIVTFGCSIPLFTFACNDVQPIDFPPSTLPESFRDRAIWLNLFDRDDVLGYPLKPIGPAYDRVVTEDREINVGGLVSSWNPMSHGSYWSDNDLVRPAAEVISAFL